LRWLGVSAEHVYFTGSLPNGFGGAPLVDDYLYGIEPGGQLLAAEFTTGKAMWKAESVGWASLAYDDGLICHGYEGEVALVEATPENYREKGPHAAGSAYA